MSRTGGGSARIGHNQKVTAARESLASGRLVLAFACTLLVPGITNTFPSSSLRSSPSSAAPGPPRPRPSPGLLGIGNSLGSALGPLLAGALHDWTGSYLVIYASAIGLVGVAVAALATFWIIARG